MMKKVLIISFLIFTAGRSFAQTLEDITSLINEKKDYVAARTAIDKYLADPKHSTDGAAYYYKGFIYNALSRNAGVSSADAYNYKVAAFDAFKKNQQLDKLDINLKSEFYASYFDIYLGLYGVGGQQFNNKEYPAAYKSFVKAQEVETYILNRNYTNDEVKLSKLDTSLVMNTGAAALQAGDTVKAVASYKKLIDEGVTGNDYEQIYEYLVSYYYDKKDDATLQPLMAKAKAAYPNNKFWNDIEMEKLSGSGDKTALFARYEEAYKADPNNFNNTYNYSVELYNELYGKDAKTPVDPAVREKLSVVLKSAIANDKSIESSVLMASHLFNWASDYSQEAALIKGTKPEDVKNKKDLNAKALVKMDEAIPYGTKSVDYYKAKATMTTKDKLNYKSILNNLSDLYNAKNDPKKAAEYDKLADGIKF